MKGNSVAQKTSFLDWRKIWASRRARLGLACLAIFLIALTGRAFHWQDNPNPPFYGMTGEYKAHAMLLVRGDLKGFLQGPNPPSNAHVIKHPPGYPLLMAVVYKIFGDSDDALRFAQIILDALSAVMVFFIAYELLSFAAATLSGFLVALSPQLGYHSVALLPDPVATLPLLVAAYLLARAYKNPRLLTLFGSGLFLGISCWFRSNAILFPLFVCALMPLLFKPGLRLRFASALLAGFLLLILPVTLRNAIYFRSFIPLSLSAGITLVEGIGVYDHEKRFGLPDNDFLVSKWEAEEFGRPDYLGDRFGVDGVSREQHRVRRGLAVIAANPIWFLKVMLHRAVSMLRLARVELVRPQPAITHDLSLPPDAIPSWTLSRNNAESGMVQNALKPGVSPDGGALRIDGKQSDLFVSDEASVTPKTDYLLRVPVKIRRGGVVVEVADAERGKALASSPVRHAVNWLDLTAETQPFVVVELPFVSGDATAVKIKLTNYSKSSEPAAVIELGPITAFALGPASQSWTNYPRLVIRFLEKFFITALMLPFTLLGVIFLARERKWRELAILVVLPTYYMSVQSALWTEFRYILSMHYFLFILAAVGLIGVAKILPGVIAKSPKKSSA